MGSPKRVCKTLSQEGILRFPERGVKWNTANLSTCLRNVVYIGRVPLGQESFPGIHQPLIEEPLWEAVQARLKEVAAMPRDERPQVPESLLHGRGVSTCPVKSVSAGILEALVEREVMKVLKTDYMTNLIASRARMSFFDVKRAMEDPAVFWSTIAPADKRNLFRELIHSVKIFPQSVEIRFRTAGCKKFMEEIKNGND